MLLSPLPAGSADIAVFFVEIGLMIIGLALLARLAMQIGFSPVPLYLLGGLLLRASGVISLSPETLSFIQVCAEIGVILLLFMIGLEYTAAELTESLRHNLPGGLLDFGLNFAPGFGLGLLLGWGPLAALLLGGVTYVSSSGIIAKVLNDLGWLGNRETPVVLSILVLEDLAMAVYLPLTVVLLLGEGVMSGAISLGMAVATVVVVFVLALKFGGVVSRLVESRSGEVVLLTTFGLILLVAGVAQQLQVSSAVGAFLVGIALSGSVAEQARELLTPLRDLFAGTFFLFFGLQIDPASLPPVLLLAAGLGLVSALTKVATGWLAARQAGIGTRGRFRAGAALIARGEFSIVIAGLGTSVGVAADLISLSAAYVLMMAVLGPVLTRFIDPVVAGVQRRFGGAPVRPRRREAVPVAMISSASDDG